MNLQHVGWFLAVILVSIWDPAQASRKKPDPPAYPPPEYAVKTTKYTPPRLPTTAALETTTLVPPVPTTEAPPKQQPTEAPAEGTTRRPKPTKPKPTLPPVDFDCKGKRDGYYADPKDKCSSKYYACVGGMARQMDCPASSLVFEPDTQACERRDESYRCSGNRKTTLAPTSPRPPVPTEKYPIDCTRMEDGWYADPSQKCNRIFYSCSNGLVSRFNCPANMYFDELWNMCMAREDVEACTGKRSVSTQPPATTKPPAPEKSPIDCAGKPSGYYPDPDKKCSSIYYACSNGVTIKRTCPEGLYYDQISQACDYQDEVFDCTGKTKPPPTKATKAPNPSPASLPSEEYSCSGKPDGGYTPEKKKCSEIFYKCIANITYKFVCPEGLYYDVENDLCDRYANLYVCSNKRPNTPKPITTPKPKPTEKVPIDCSNKADGDYPNPLRKCCSTYYSCSGAIGIRRSCPENTFFDEQSGICDIREHVPACTGKPRPATTTPKPITKRPVVKYPFDCSNKADGWYENDKEPCSSLYWGCVGGSTSRGECPAGTVYDSEYGQCGYREEIPKCGGVRPPTEEP